MALPPHLPGFTWDDRTQRYYADTRNKSSEANANARAQEKEAEEIAARRTRGIELPSTRASTSYFDVVQGRETLGLRRGCNRRTGDGVEARHLQVAWKHPPATDTNQTQSRCAGGLVLKPHPPESDHATASSRDEDEREYVVASRGAHACVRWIYVSAEGQEDASWKQQTHMVDCVPHLSAMRCRWEGQETVRVACTTLAERRKNGKLVILDAGLKDRRYGAPTEVHIRSKCECVLRGKGDFWTLEYAQDGTKISVGSETGAFVVNAERTTMDVLWNEPRKNLAALAQQFDCTGNLLYNGRRNGRIVLYDLRTSPCGEQGRMDMGKLLARANTGVCTLQLARPHETYLISGTFGGAMHLWDVRAAKAPVHVFRGLDRGGMQYDIALGKDARGMDTYVAAPGADAKVGVWNIRTAELLTSIDCGEQMPDRVACNRWRGQFAVWVALEREERIYQHCTE